MPSSGRHHRKRIEEIFGWLKTIGGLRKSRYIGLERTELHAYLAASAYNPHSPFLHGQDGAGVASARLRANAGPRGH